VKVSLRFCSVYPVAPLRGEGRGEKRRGQMKIEREAESLDSHLSPPMTQANYTRIGLQTEISYQR